MIGSKLKASLVLLAGIMGSTLAQAQTPAALLYDPGAVSISFAAGDLKAALRQNGYLVTDSPLGDPSGLTQSVRIILTTSDVSMPGKPSVSGLTAQGYAIQRVVDGAATNWWVVGLNADGFKLFDAAVGWAATARFQPPVVQGGQIKLEWAGGGTLQATTNAAGPWSNVAGAVSPYLHPNTNSAQFFRVKQ